MQSCQNLGIIFFREILQTDILSVAAPSLPPSSSSGLEKKIARAKAIILMTKDKKGSINGGLRAEKTKQTYNNNYSPSQMADQCPDKL